MRKLAVILLMFLVACGGEAVVEELETESAAPDGIAAGLYERTLDIGGVERQFLLYVPTSYAADSAPLLFNFHGYGGTADSQLNYADFREISDREGFILVYPQGTVLAGGETHWSVGGWTARSTADDIGFVQGMIETLSAELAIDPDRIYSTGHSNGGYFSFRLACELSDEIAAVASMSGVMTPDGFATCDPTSPVPVLQMHGTADDVVPYGGASWSKSVDDVLEFWIESNGLEGEPQVTEIPADPSTTANTTLERSEVMGDEVSVVHVQVDGGGHEWLGQENRAGQVNLDLDPNEAIWAFFAQYDVNGRID